MLADRLVDCAIADEEDAETARIGLSSLLVRVRQGGPAAEVALLDADERCWMPDSVESDACLRLRVVGLLRAA